MSANKIMNFALLAISFFMIASVDAKNLFIKKTEDVRELKKLPIVFSRNYDISFFGIEKLHPFDSKKYGKVAQFLKDKLHISDKQFHCPQNEVSVENLKKVHTEKQLKSLQQPSTIQQFVGIPGLRYLPNWILQRCLMKPMRYATQGTIDAAQIALKEGVAINLSGGYHHAESDSASGFCAYADIPLAIRVLRESNPELKIMYVDLDAHQGNGVEAILKDDKNSYIVDCYNEWNFPRDLKAAERIDKKILSNQIYCDSCKGGNLKRPCADCNTSYLEALKSELPAALKEFREKYHQNPDMIFYNAGTDCFEEDPLGLMNLSEQGIIERDEFVFQQAKDNKIAICMTLSGGYTKKSAAIIGASIVNLHKKGLLDFNKQ